MSKDKGKGSILLKIVIIILLAGLIAVILIPGEIWNTETSEQKTEQYNLMSIYEALRFYHRTTGNYTTEPKDILNTVRADSSILVQQKVVNYTQQLAGLIDQYVDIVYIKNILEVDQNIDRILEDLESNRRNFRLDENLSNEAEDLQLKLAELNNASQYTNYVFASTYLDSLVQLRRDLSDFSLQEGASRSSSITDTLNGFISDIDITGLENAWVPLSNQIKQFIGDVRGNEEIIKLTSVADRVKDFDQNVNDAFVNLKSSDVQQDINTAQDLSSKLRDAYNTFLADFVVTSKPALYRLSESDSLVIHLTEDNFYSPVTGEMYKIFILDDSNAVKVESPVLVNELKAKTDPIAEEIKELDIHSKFKAYFDTMNTVKEKAYQIRRALRKNTDVFIKYKEIEENINQFNDISVTTANRDLHNFIEIVPVSESYSELKNQLENALNGVRIFHQAYSQNFFGNLDSLHRDLKQNMEEFNELLNSVRRLPRNVKKFDEEFTQLDQLQQDLKSLNVAPQLEKIELDVSTALEYAAEGEKRPVYGVFNKTIQNFGNIYKDNRSWEEED